MRAVGREAPGGGGGRRVAALRFARALAVTAVGVRSAFGAGAPRPRSLCSSKLSPLAGGPWGPPPHCARACTVMR